MTRFIQILLFALGLLASATSAFAIEETSDSNPYDLAYEKATAAVVKGNAIYAEAKATSEDKREKILRRAKKAPGAAREAAKKLEACRGDVREKPKHNCYKLVLDESEAALEVIELVEQLTLSHAEELAAREAMISATSKAVDKFLEVLNGFPRVENEPNEQAHDVSTAWFRTTESEFELTDGEIDEGTEMGDLLLFQARQFADSEPVFEELRNDQGVDLADANAEMQNLRIAMLGMRVSTRRTQNHLAGTSLLIDATRRQRRMKIDRLPVDLFIQQVERMPTVTADSDARQIQEVQELMDTVRGATPAKTAPVRRRIKDQLRKQRNKRRAR